MKPRNGDYPVRMFIRHKAILRLQDAAAWVDIGTPIDEILFKDITETLFNADTNPELYRSYASREQAAEVEDQVVSEIVQTYRHIQSQISNPIVQRLNALI
ncbi:MAG: hypothetical protein AAFW84_20545 [Cyanobacteria bacterium J06635_15]